MKEFVVYEDKETLDFRLCDREKPKEVSFLLDTKNAAWSYTAHYFRWLEFSLVNGKFQVTFDADGPNETVSEKELENITNEFYELMRRVKNHPEYRLKVINLLNKETRKLWDVI